MLRTTRALGTLVFITLITPGCEDRADDATPPQAATAEHHASAPNTATGPTHPATPLNESQSVEALGTLNAGEIELARYALGRTQTTQGRDLAQMMIDQHTEAEANVVAWALAHSVVGETNDVTPAVTTIVSSVRTRLEYASDANFDRTYAQTQIEMHEGALDILDNRVLPGARDASFRTLVTTIRGGVATHLAHARMVLAEVPVSSAGVATSDHTH